jgi:DNA-binding transcriptional ArsR family regulator
MGVNKMKPEQIVKIDPLVHAPARLAILSILINLEKANFSYLKEATGLTDGNLSTNLTKLEESGLIKIEKIFVAKKPQTNCSITKKGRETLIKYLEQLEQIIRMHE